MELEFEFGFELEEPPVLDGAGVVAFSLLVYTDVLDTGMVVAVCGAAPAEKNPVKL